MLDPRTAVSAQFSVINPASGIVDDAEHKGPTVIAPEGHIMVVHRGHDAPVTVKAGQIISLCEGDVVRVLSDPEQ
jgi:hypothetical protein